MLERSDRPHLARVPARPGRSAADAGMRAAPLAADRRPDPRRQGVAARRPPRVRAGALPGEPVEITLRKRRRKLVGEVEDPYCERRALMLHVAPSARPRGTRRSAGDRIAPASRPPARPRGRVYGIELTAQQLEAEKDQIRVEHVGLAIVADRSEIAALVGGHPRRSCRACLATRSSCDTCSSDARPLAVCRQHVHEVDVPPSDNQLVVVAGTRGRCRPSSE